MTIASDPVAALDRHQARREAGQPTVSVLSGPVGLAIREARRWAEDREWPVVPVTDPRLDPIVDAWADRLAEVRDLRRDAVARIARDRGEPADDLGPRVARMAPVELADWLGSTGPGQLAPGVEAACRWILERSAAGETPTAPDLAAWLGSEPAWVALGDLIPPDQPIPVLLAAPASDGPETVAWVESAARSMARLALARPRSPTILAVGPVALDAYLRLAPESREKALIRAGVVTVNGLDGDGIGRKLAGLAPGLGRSVDRIARDGATDRLADLFAEAAEANAHPGAQEADDRARSAAERFLFERLESLPATAGLFGLNQEVDIPFGPGRAMEIDLFARNLGLAVEIDGYYHFRDEECYRRDRRKDFLIQRRGYLVIRVLAVDVVHRLEEVLDLILAAVEHRRTGPDALNRENRP